MAQNYMLAALNQRVAGGMEPQPGLVKNHQGGYVHQISDFARFKRFLILGSDANTFYADAKELTLENAKIVVDLLAANMGLEMVSEIVAVSQTGRAPRQSPGLFALAIILSLAKAGPDTLPGPEDSPDQRTAKGGKAKHARKVRKAAMEALPLVCRTASTLYELMAYYKVLNLGEQKSDKAGLGLWSHSLRKAISDWYLNKKPLDVAMQVSKYKTRNGISSRDLLRLAHPKASELGKRKRDEDVDDMQLVLKFAAHMDDEVAGEGEVSQFLKDCQRLKAEKDVDRVVELLKAHRQLGWEHVGESKLLKQPAVWAALLDQGMGLTALIRNLSRFLEIKLIGNAVKADPMASLYGGYGYLGYGYGRHTNPALAKNSEEDKMDEGEGSDKKAKEEEIVWRPEKDYLELITSKLTNKEALVKARIHPLRALLAQLTILKKWDRASLPQPLLTSLEQAFELSFAAAKPTGKKFLLALDVSSSMNSPCMGSDVLTCRQAESAIAVILNRIETDVKVVAFCHKLLPFPIQRQESLENVTTRMNGMSFGGTDCSLPIKHAIDNDLDVDVFVTMTDNETYLGHNVSQLLGKYRRIQAAKGRTEPAKMMVLAFSSTGFSIADPNDPGMLDVAGFDSSIPEIMEDFVLGSLTSKL